MVFSIFNSDTASNPKTFSSSTETYTSHQLVPLPAFLGSWQPLTHFLYRLPSLAILLNSHTTSGFLAWFLLPTLEAVASNSISCLFVVVISYCLNPPRLPGHCSAVAKLFPVWGHYTRCCQDRFQHASVQHVLNSLRCILGRVSGSCGNSNIFKELSNCFAQGPLHFTSPMATTVSSHHTQPHQHRYLLCCPIALWLYEFPSDQQHWKSFMCLLTTCLSSLKKCWFKPLANFYLFWPIKLEIYLHILNTRP